MIKKHLHIPWTNADPLTANLMVVVYATNAMLNPWWEEVTVIIWGATTKLAAEASRGRKRLAQHLETAPLYKNIDAPYSLFAELLVYLPFEMFIMISFLINKKLSM